ncbi:MAG TPA: preprotein translocase subunit SecG [Gemmatales bacterium]|nr:preprotein translocase subunit SecG [Gemmatales bacterium]HMP61263.1 preprotein translocase subunit SecG [Gemmatales bacterium]
MAVLLSVIIFLTGIALILLILIQRGRGGGLVGALGGGGTASPFGSRAGDTFTRYTIILALVWIALNMILTLTIQPGRVVRQAATEAPPAVPGGTEVPPGSTAPTAPIAPAPPAVNPGPESTTPR